MMTDQKACNIHNYANACALIFRFQRDKLFLPRSFVTITYCGEPPWPRSSVFVLGPPGLEFRILSPEGSIISFISPSSGSPDPI